VSHYDKQNTMLFMYRLLFIKNKKQNNFRKTDQHIFSSCVACSPKLMHSFVQNTGS